MAVLKTTIPVAALIDSAPMSPTRSATLPRVLLMLSLALAPATLLGGSGCDRDKDLKAIAVPDEGVLLAYSFEIGRDYNGQIERREALNFGGTTLNRSLRFDTTLRLLETKSNGDLVLEATVRNIAITWALPPSVPISMGEFLARAKARLENAHIQVTIGKDGKVKDLPDPPAELDDEERLVAQSLLDGLESAFLVVPARPLRSGETWNDEVTKGREGKLGRFVQGKTTTKFAGLFERSLPDGDQRVGKLTIENTSKEVVTSKTGARQTDLNSDTVVLFDVAGGYLAKIQGTERRVNADSSSEIKFLATFTVSSESTQLIDDPCHPDYVGELDCEPPAPAGTPASDEGTPADDGERTERPEPSPE